MKIIFSIRLIAIVLSSLFCAFVFFYEKESKIVMQETIKQHAQIVSSSLWNFDKKSHVEYLTIIANHYDYKTISILDNDDQIFMSTRGPALQWPNSILLSLKLIPIVNLTTPIFFKDKKIGTIVISRYHKSIYTYFYLFFVFFLILIVFYFYKRLKINNRLLETRVEERTKVLKESEGKYRDMFEQSPIGLALCTMDGQLVAVNPAYATIIGYSVEDTLQLTYLDIIPEKKSPDERWPLNELDTAEHHEKEYRHKDGHFVPVRLNAKIVVRDNQKFIWLNVEDITVLKQSEKETYELQDKLRQAQKMESIGTLAGGIAHDFNNILAAILGYAEMAKDDSQSGSTTYSYLEEVLNAGNRAKTLVTQILAFSRHDDTECIPLQPAIMAKETIKMLRPALPSTIKINQRIDHETDRVFADPTQFHQIMMNLCTNAYQAMEETGGKLDISLKQVNLSNEDLVHEPNVTNGDFIQLSIGDSGIGIAKNLKNKIFDPYFTTKESGKGTGLGLSTVHGIVKNYGGFISLYSELGEGTVFHVFLPCVEKKAETINESNHQIPTGTENILFVDDEEILTQMGKTMLQGIGYHVTARNSSFEALETFQSQPDKFDIVITDQTMPGMTGSELCRRMLHIRPDIPIILCTGYSTIISEEKAKAMGIKEFAFKPLAKMDLAKLIRKVLDAS
ncbi:MAG: response regulator [Desulfotalea sp.]